MATFVAAAAYENFQGTAEADDFYLYLPYASYQHTMNGGGVSTTGPIDRLFLSGYVNDNYLPALSFYFSISNIEQVYLSSSGGALYFYVDFLNSSATHKVEVFGQGNGADKINVLGDLLSSQANFYGGDGNDYLEMSFGFTLGVGGSVELHGDGGDDTIYGRGWLDGGSGNDTIGAMQYSYVTAGTGDDTVYCSSENCFLDGGDGTDTLVLPYSSDSSEYYNFEILKAGNVRISLSQLGHFSQIQAYDPNSSVGVQFKFFGGGSFNFQGLAVSPAFLTIDIVDTSALNYQIIGSAYVNYFRGGTGNDVFIGGNSYNNLNGGSGNDYLVGGANADKLEGWLGSDTLFGGGGNDSLYLGGFSSYGSLAAAYYNVAYGGEGNDSVTVTSDSNIYQGGIVDGGAGYDTLYTDADLNAYSISSVESLYGTGQSLHATVAQLNSFQSISAVGVTIYVGGSGMLDLGPKLGSSNVAVNLIGETTGDLILVGTQNNDSLTGGQGLSVLYGGGGGDRLVGKGTSSSAAPAYIYGGGGDDGLYGGASNDYLFGDDGSDIVVTNSEHKALPGHAYVDGGAGNDWIILNGAGDIALGGIGNDLIYANGTNAYAFGGDGDDSLVSYSAFETYDASNRAIGTNYVDGGGGNDSIEINGKGDVAYGGDGNDSIEVYGSGTTGVGGEGNDVLQGGSLANYLFGGNGVDVIGGFWGNDYMVGGGNTDYFVLNGDVKAGDVDYIADFKPGEDWIGLPSDVKVNPLYFDTAYGIALVCVINSSNYYAFLLGNHDVNAVKSSVYFYGL